MTSPSPRERARPASLRMRVPIPRLFSFLTLRLAYGRKSVYDSMDYETACTRIIRAAYTAGLIGALVETIDRTNRLEQVSWIADDISLVLLTMLYGILLAELLVRPLLLLRKASKRADAAIE